MLQKESKATRKQKILLRPLTRRKTYSGKIVISVLRRLALVLLFDDLRLIDKDRMSNH